MTPVTFPFDTGWFAVRTALGPAVIPALGLTSLRQVGWGEGLEAVRLSPKHLFITPPVSGWVLLFGDWALGTGRVDDVRRIEATAALLSAHFGEAQCFADSRQRDYRHWILARGGRVERAFAYDAQSGEVLRRVGIPTPAEFALPGAERPETEWTPDRQALEAVVSRWSLHPAEAERRGSAAGSGILALAPER